MASVPGKDGGLCPAAAGGGGVVAGSGLGV